MDASLITERNSAMPITLQSQIDTDVISSASVLLGILLVVALLLWCTIRPDVGRRFARMFAVLAIGTGIGVLTWGICAAALGEVIRSPFGLTSLIAEASEAIGWGAGSLAAGITALVLSYVGGCRSS
jgi:hypothetical protein